MFNFLIKKVEVLTDTEYIVKFGDFIEGEGEIFHIKEEKIKKTKTKLKYNKGKNVSEGILIEDGIVYFVEFKDGKELENSRKTKYGGARIMIVGVQSVGKVRLFLFLLFLFLLFYFQ